VVRSGALDAAHLVEDDWHPGAGALPRRFGPGETAADDVNGLHAALLASRLRESVNEFQLFITAAG